MSVGDMLLDYAGTVSVRVREAVGAYWDSAAAFWDSVSSC